MQVYKRFRQFIDFRQPELKRKYIALILIVFVCGVIFLWTTGSAVLDKPQSAKNDVIESQTIENEPQVQNVNGFDAGYGDGLTTTGKLSCRRGRLKTKDHLVE